MSSLLKSRKFWLAVQDAVVSTALLVVGMYYPAYSETVKTLVLIWQVPTTLLIVGITVEDSALKRSTGAPYRKP